MIQHSESGGARRAGTGREVQVIRAIYYCKAITSLSRLLAVRRWRWRRQHLPATQSSGAKRSCGGGIRPCWKCVTITDSGTLHQTGKLPSLESLASYVDLLPHWRCCYRGEPHEPSAARRAGVGRSSRCRDPELMAAAPLLMVAFRTALSHHAGSGFTALMGWQLTEMASEERSVRYHPGRWRSCCQACLLCSLLPRQLPHELMIRV